MFNIRDLFQWERFITPAIIKIFYWLVVALTVLVGITGILAGLAQMFLSPITGFISIVSSLFAIFIGIIFARIAAEFVLMIFRINDHLGAIRNRGSGM
jgi:hypothetical protein